MSEKHSVFENLFFYRIGSQKENLKVQKLAVGNKADIILDS